MPALRRSASSASATPGYWILTATGRPSSSVARCTWPIEAAANASRLELGEVLVDRLAVLLLDHLRRPRSHGIGGAEVRSFASCSW